MCKIPVVVQPTCITAVRLTGDDAAELNVTALCLDWQCWQSFEAVPRLESLG